MPLVVLVMSAACGSGQAAAVMEGRWTGPDGSFVELRAGGEASGRDGCNDFSAEWGARGESEGRFEVTASTEVGCPGAFAFSDARTYTVVDGDMVLRSRDGDSVWTLTRDE